MSSSAAALARGKSGISAAKFEASKGLGAKPKRSASATGSRGKTEKKVYSLPGQKFDPPEEREPLRIFYESLSKQIPSSEMAEFWYAQIFTPFSVCLTNCSDQLYYPSTSSTKMYNRLMEHGLLSPERAKKAYEKKQKRQQQIRSGTPIKPSVKKDKPESSKKPSSYNSSDSKAKKRVDYSDDDDDFISLSITSEMLTPRLNAATQMPVASPRRQPMSSSAHSGGAQSPSSSPTLSLCCGDDVGDGSERLSCCGGCWLRHPDPRAERGRSKCCRRPRTPPLLRLGEVVTVAPRARAPTLAAAAVALAAAAAASRTPSPSPPRHALAAMERDEPLQQMN
uniref:Uncharacterized protein n=2 Tax=Oryza rufipogon TaxID=4529 RepID=A0A0E0PS70_ORYRU